MERIEIVNPERITWCCEDRGVTLDDLAMGVGMDPTNLRDVVDRDAFLTVAQLTRVAEFFGRGLLFFLEPGPVEELRVHSPQFRTLANQKTSLTPRLLTLIERVERQRKVFMGLRQELGQAVADFEPPAIEANQDLSRLVRRWLGVSETNDFNSYRRAIEARGILVFRTNGYAGAWQIDKESPICGFSIYRRKCPVIVVKKEFFEPRQTFTLLHELGHLILHRRSFIDDTDDLFMYAGEERDANAFAGAVLVPSQFLEQVNDLERPKEVRDYPRWLGKHRDKWGVSVEVILRRLTDLGRLRTQSYESYRKWSQDHPPTQEDVGGNRSYRYREPSHVFGNSYVKTVLDAMSAQQITLARASAYLDNLKVKDVHKLETFFANV